MPSSPHDEIVFNINWRRVRFGMLWIALLVLTLHVYVGVTDQSDLIGESLWRRLANLDSETSFPTWLSSALLAAAGVLCWVESRMTNPEHRRRWTLLGFGFLILSIDEVAAIHETAAGPLRRALDLEGALYYGWVLPAILIVATAVAYFYPLLRSLPGGVRIRIVTAGAVFVAGAIGMEMVSGVLTEQGEREAWSFFAVATLEEAMEIGAIFLFVDTLASWLASRGVPLRVTIRQA